MPSTEVHLKHKEVNYAVLQNLSQTTKRKRLRKLASKGSKICDGDREGMDDFVRDLKTINQ